MSPTRRIFGALVSAAAAAWWAGAATVALAATNDNSGIKFNLTLTPLDPAFSLEPNPVDGAGHWTFNATSGDGGLASARVHYSASSTNRPRLAVSFQGDGYYIHGQPPDGAKASDMQVIVDGAEQSDLPAPTAGTDVVVSATDLAWKTHDVVFSPVNGEWDIESVVVTTGMVTQAPTFEDVTFSAVSFAVDDGLNGWFNYTGNWTSLSALPDGGSQAPPYAHAVGNSGAEVTFAVPANTSFLVINGTTGPENGQVMIALAPQLNRTGYAVQTTVNTSRPFRSSGRLAFVQLNSAELYTARIATQQGPLNATRGGLHDVSFYSAFSNITRPPDTSSGISKDVIIGAAVGGGVGLLLFLTLLLFFLLCWKHRRSSHSRPPSRSRKPPSLDFSPAASEEMTEPEPQSPQWYAAQYAVFPHSPQDSPLLASEYPTQHPNSGSAEYAMHHPGSSEYVPSSPVHSTMQHPGSPTYSTMQPSSPTYSTVQHPHSPEFALHHPSPVTVNDPALMGFETQPLVGSPHPPPLMDPGLLGYESQPLMSTSPTHASLESYPSFPSNPSQQSHPSHLSHISHRSQPSIGSSSSLNLKRASATSQLSNPYMPPLSLVFDREYATPSPSGTLKNDGSAHLHPYPGARLSITNPDPTPRPSRQTSYEGREGAAGYADSQFTTACHGTPAPEEAHHPQSQSSTHPFMTTTLPRPMKEAGTYTMATPAVPHVPHRAETPSSNGGLKPQGMRLPFISRGLQVPEEEPVGRAV